jgi:hypothetical protein
MTIALKVSMEGDMSREMSFALEPLQEGVSEGNWTKQYESGIGVTPTSGYWSYGGAEGEIWLSESSDVFLQIRVDSDWSSALLDGRTILGQGYLMHTTQGDVNCMYSMAAS